MSPRPRKITPEQLERIREDAKRNWGRAMKRLGPDEPLVIRDVKNHWLTREQADRLIAEGREKLRADGTPRAPRAERTAKEPAPQRQRRTR